MRVILLKWVATLMIGACVLGCETIPRRSELAIMRLANAVALKAGYNLSDYETHAVYRPLHEGHQ